MSLKHALRFASLGSGSKGNATVVAFEKTTLLVDNGFTLRETERRLQRLGVDAADIDAVLLTHEHSDHAKGVAPLCRKYNIPLYATHGSCQILELNNVEVNYISGGDPVAIGEVIVAPVTVPHDSREPVQFILESAQTSLGILTDLGSITPHVLTHYKSCDALLIECNHDEEMLAQGPYPYTLKKRVGGDWGHLNNRQAAELLRCVALREVQHLVLAHISENNNSVGKVRGMASEFEHQVQNLVIADQGEGFDWLSVNTPAHLSDNSRPCRHPAQTRLEIADAELD